MLAQLQLVAGAVWSPKTERAVITRLLGVPLLVGIACILIALAAFHAGWVGQGAAPLTGLLRAFMILVALGVFWSFACGLWYVIGVGWFLLATRAAKLQGVDNRSGYLISTLWKLPLASAALCWIPLFTHLSVIPHNMPRWALVIGMIVTQLIITYLWIAIVRAILRWKHGF